MSRIRTFWDDRGSWAVMPVVSPTVPKAENASKRVRDSGRPLWAVKTSVAATTAPSPMRATARAWRWAPTGMRRRKALTVDHPRASAAIISRSTAKVVTRMPPLVPALPAPMNMRMSVTSHDVSPMAP
jgi:hypothetical protein